MFKKIVIALDGSECAKQALEVAIQLAGEGAELGICSIVDPIVIAGTAPPSPAMDLMIRDMHGQARELVSEAVERARAAGIRADGRECSGVAAYEILKYAEHFKADLIVMGTHGRTGIRHLLMGSVAEVVLRQAPVPVLIVRERLAASKKANAAK
ncbi:MAG: universal stress protein [Candidatus Baltobacteraceae bacterium]